MSSKPVRIDRDWLASRNACGPDFEAFLREFGGEGEVSRASYERARAAGLNLLWLGVRLVDDAGRRDFVAFTIAQRGPALEAILGGPVPAAAGERAALAEAARQQWQRTRDYDQRKRALVLADLEADEALQVPGPVEAERAIRHCLRAVSAASIDEGPVRAALLEFLAERIVPQ